MTIDNLLGATSSTADGALREVSATSEPDLFWALRGGGGNFGVVTSFEFQLHPVGPEVYAGPGRLSRSRRHARSCAPGATSTRTRRTN